MYPAPEQEFFLLKIENAWFVFFFFSKLTVEF